MDWPGHIDKTRMDDLYLGGALEEINKYGLDSCHWVWYAVCYYDELVKLAEWEL